MRGVIFSHEFPIYASVEKCAPRRPTCGLSFQLPPPVNSLSLPPPQLIVRPTLVLDADHACLGRQQAPSLTRVVLV